VISLEKEKMIEMNYDVISPEFFTTDQSVVDWLNAYEQSLPALGGQVLVYQDWADVPSGDPFRPNDLSPQGEGQIHDIMENDVHSALQNGVSRYLQVQVRRFSNNTSSPWGSLEQGREWLWLG
jgi:hypothetical protein